MDFYFAILVWNHTCNYKSNSRCALVWFWNHAYDFSPNCTPLSSITIINHDCARSRTKEKTPANQRLLKDEATKSIGWNRWKNPAASVAKSRVFVHWHVPHMFVHLQVQYVIYTPSCAIRFLEHLFEFLCMMGNFWQVQAMEQLEFRFWLIRSPSTSP